MKRADVLSILMLFIATLLPSQVMAIKAFPGAEGFGANATGGRGGRVIEVTNTKGDASAGSFRAALKTSGTDPITIVFRVSGCISFDTSVIKCGRSNMTIAGQTAPGDGICLRKGKIYFSGSNLVIRYLRFRVGDEYKVSLPALDIENCMNVIVDHCSLSWSVEENMDNYDTRYTTVQWCIISEGLYNSYNVKGARAYGSQWGGQYASYHHNLFAHNASRSPRVNGCRSHDTVALCDYRNNVIYNWGKFNAIYGGEVEIAGGSACCKVNWIGNYYAPGPATASSHYFAQPSYNDGSGTTTGYAKWYFSGNYMAGVNGGMNTSNWDGVDISQVTLASNIKSTSVFAADSVTTQSASDAFALVLDSAGAILPERDSVDIRIVGQARGTTSVKSGGTYGSKTGIIDSPDSVGGWPAYNSKTAPSDSDHDGMPDTWEKAHNLNPYDSIDRNDLDVNGYTMLEDYLNNVSTIASTALPLYTNRLFPGLRIAVSGSNKTNAFFSYHVPSFSFVTLKLFTLNGRQISTLENGSRQPGTYTSVLPVKNMAVGTFLVRLTASGHSVCMIFTRN